MITQLVITPHSKLSVNSFGERRLPLIILLHGGPGTPDYLTEVALLLQNHFHPVTFDQRGTGKSEALNHSYTLSEYLQDIRAIANHFGQESFHLFGHSWGGLLAQWYAGQFPNQLESLFLCNPVPGTGWHWISMIAEESIYIFKRASWNDLFRIIEAYLLGQFSNQRADEGWQQFYDIVWRHYFTQPKTVTKMSPEWEAGTRAEPIRETVKTILGTPARKLDKLPFRENLPTAILYGKDDFLQWTRKPVLKRFPWAKFYEVADAGHVPWVANRTAFIQFILDFYTKKGGS